MRQRTLFVLVLAALAPIAAIGCGGDDGDDNGATTAADSEATESSDAATQDAAGTSAAQKVTIKLNDFLFDPKDATAPSGAVEITTPNEGQTEHELVLFKSDADPAKLPVVAGEVDETAFEKSGAENVGEIEEVLPGETKSNDFELTPGKYVMICNLPGHYLQGMYGSVTVK